MAAEHVASNLWIASSQVQMVYLVAVETSLSCELVISSRDGQVARHLSKQIPSMANAGLLSLLVLKAFARRSSGGDSNWTFKWDA